MQKDQINKLSEEKNKLLKINIVRIVFNPAHERRSRIEERRYQKYDDDFQQPRNDDEFINAKWI